MQVTLKLTAKDIKTLLELHKGHERFLCCILSSFVSEICSVKGERAAISGTFGSPEVVVYKNSLKERGFRKFNSIHFADSLGVELFNFSKTVVQRRFGSQEITPEHALFDTLVDSPYHWTTMEANFSRTQQNGKRIAISMTRNSQSGEYERFEFENSDDGGFQFRKWILDQLIEKHGEDWLMLNGQFETE